MTYALIPDSGPGSVNFIELVASYIAPLDAACSRTCLPSLWACSR